MSIRVSPLERIRAEIDECFSSDRDLGDMLEEVARLGVRLLIQSAMEAEVTEFLGRDRYAHGERAREGSRNGHCPTTIKTTAGPVTICRPKLRGTNEVFASRLLGIGVVRTNALESLVIAGFVRGLSVRDMEATLADALGPEAALSKSTVSRVCEAIRDEFDAWRRRSLTDVHLEYLFLDGSDFRYHDGARAEPVLAAWGITTEGTPVLVSLEPGASESTDAWADFLKRDGRTRAAGAAAGRLRRRPRPHRRRRARVPAQPATTVRNPPLPEHPGQGPRGAPGRGEERLLEDLDPTGEAPGERSIAVARSRADTFSATYGRQFPAAVACLNDDLPSLFTYLRFPVEHHKRIRHSNFIERTFGETRRRGQGHRSPPGERGCLSLVWAVLNRASRGWRGVVMNPAAVRQLQHLRREQLAPTVEGEEVVTEAVTDDAKHRQRSLRPSGLTPHLGRHPPPQASMICRCIAWRNRNTHDRN